MNWRQVGAYHAVSDEGFSVARFGMGDVVTFAAYHGKKMIHAERDIPKEDEQARRAAVKRCQEACARV